MTLAEVLNKALEGGYRLNGLDGMDTGEASANSACSAWPRSDNDATCVADVQAPWLDPQFWRALGLALGWYAGVDTKCLIYEHWRDSRGTALSITSPTGTPRKPSLRACPFLIAWERKEHERNQGRPSVVRATSCELDARTSRTLVRSPGCGMIHSFHWHGTAFDHQAWEFDFHQDHAYPRSAQSLIRQDERALRSRSCSHPRTSLAR